MFSMESLSNEFNSLFEPLDKKYCNLFYGISVWYFLLIISSVVTLIIMLKDMKRNRYLIINSVLITIALTINYIYNRLLFNMCK